MSQVYKVSLKGVNAKLFGYANITPTVVRNLLKEESLLFRKNENSCLLRLEGAFCSFAYVHIKPEVYCMAEEDLRLVHGKIGFCFLAWIAYSAESWVVDMEREYLAIYTPFTNELVVVPAEAVCLEPVSPWYRFWAKSKRCMTYVIRDEAGVRLSREFQVRYNTLRAQQDILGYQEEPNKYKWFNFYPMYFVYHDILSKDELRRMYSDSVVEEEL